MDNFAKILIYTGAALIAAGGIVFVLNKFGFWRLPGDIFYDGKNWKVFFPITSCIIISIVLTLISLLINHFRK